jgi:hypothetical protein
MGQTVRVYNLVTENDDCHLLVDNRGALIYWSYCEDVLPPVEVRWLQSKFFPCINCRHQHDAKNPATNIHRMQQRNKSYTHNLKQGKELGIGDLHSGYAEIIGQCDDFDPIT